MPPKSSNLREEIAKAVKDAQNTYNRTPATTALSDHIAGALLALIEARDKWEPRSISFRSHPDTGIYRVVDDTPKTYSPASLPPVGQFGVTTTDDGIAENMITWRFGRDPNEIPAISLFSSGDVDSLSITTSGVTSLRPLGAKIDHGVYQCTLRAIAFSWRGRTIVKLPWPFSWPFKQTPGLEFSKD